MNESQRHDLYVGYRPLPRRHVVAVRLVVSALLVLAVVLGAVIAAMMDQPGPGSWATDESVTMRGIVRAQPYAHLETDQGDVMLVGVGKFGIDDRLIGLDGQAIQATGTRLVRGRWTMLETTSFRAEMPESRSPRPVTERLGHFAAMGEIVDSKCYLGAMKPGDGVTHRSCAVLCLRGGIAPMFVGTTPEGDAIAGIVTSADGGPMPDAWFDRVGVPVTAEGTVVRSGTLVELRLDHVVSR